MAYLNASLSSQLDPKPFKRVSAFWFSSTKIACVAGGSGYPRGKKFHSRTHARQLRRLLLRKRKGCTLDSGPTPA